MNVEVKCYYLGHCKKTGKKVSKILSKTDLVSYKETQKLNNPNVISLCLLLYNFYIVVSARMLQLFVTKVYK